MVEITCERCGRTWDRDARPRCRLCGSERLIRTPRPLLAHGRGTQTTPAGHFNAYACADCGGRNVTSSHARPAGDPGSRSAGENA